MGVEDDKRAAAEAAAELVEPGMRVGLGTGSTIAHLLPAIARRSLPITCVATSPRTEDAARRLGLNVEPFESLDRLDLAIDGADQIAPDGWLVKGGGGAHTREKIVAASATRFVVIADATKPVARLGSPVPLELLAFGVASTLRRIGAAIVRAGQLSPDGGVLAMFTGEFDDPGVLAARLASVPGVVDHGLFPPMIVDTVLVGRNGEAEELPLSPGTG